MNETTRLMASHRSIRRFQDAPLPAGHIAEAVRCGQMASTSSAVQSYSVIRVQDAARLDRLAELAGPQEKVKHCGAFFVLCADTRRHRVLCERAGRAFDNSFENLLVAIVDVSLFAQNFSLAFESMGYGVCYIGGIRNDLGAVCELLALPPGVFPVYGLCVGVPAESPGVRPRLPVDAVLFEDAYPDDETLLGGVHAYDEIYRAYLADRGAEPRGWSEAMVGKHTTPTRHDVGPIFVRQGAPL